MRIFRFFSYNSLFSCRFLCSCLEMSPMISTGAIISNAKKRTWTTFLREPASPSAWTKKGNKTVRIVVNVADHQRVKLTSHWEYFGSMKQKTTTRITQGDEMRTPQNSPDSILSGVHDLDTATNTENRRMPAAHQSVKLRLYSRDLSRSFASASSAIATASLSPAYICRQANECRSQIDARSTNRSSKRLF